MASKQVSHANLAFSIGWNALIATPPEKFIDLLMERASNATAEPLLREDALRFLAKQIKPLRLPKNIPDLPKREVKHRTIMIGSGADGKYCGTKIRSFTFNGRKHTVARQTWKQALLDLCELIAKDNMREFDNDNILNVGGRARIYFTKHKESLTDPREIPGTDFFVETNLSANNIKLLCDKLCWYFGYGDALECSFYRYPN